MTDAKTSKLVDAHGRPAKAEPVRCPRCQIDSPPGDDKRRARSGGFGVVHDCCVNCGYEWEESTV